MKSLPPEAYVMRRESWQMFGTLTFKNSKVRQAARLAPFFSFIRKVASVSGVHFNTILWVHRLELGELNGRPHYHVVLSGLPTKKCTRRTCEVFSELWEGTLGFGIADLRLWDGRDAVSYISKPDAYSSAGANAYESGKFGSSDFMVTFSNSFFRKYGLEAASVPAKTCVLNSRLKLSTLNSKAFIG